MVQAKCQLILCAVLALSGCGPTRAGTSSPPHWASIGKRCSADAPAVSLPDSVRGSLGAPREAVRDDDARWAQFARRIPGGWGGFLLDRGVPTIYLVDTARRSEAIAEINRHGLDGRTLGSKVSVRKGRWDFAQLYDWYRFLTPRLATPGIVSTDIDEGANRLLYGVATTQDVQELDRRLTSLDVPCFLVAIQVVPYPSLAAPAG